MSVRYSDKRVYLFTTDDAARASDFVPPTEPMAIFDPIWGGAKAAKFTRDGGALIIEYENNKLAIWMTGRWRRSVASLSNMRRATRPGKRKA